MHSFNSQSHNCKLFYFDDLRPIILPCFFSDSLSKYQTVFIRKKMNENEIAGASLTEVPIEISSVNIIVNRLDSFLHWVEDYSRNSKHVSMDTHHNLSSKLLNYYVNDVLIQNECKSINSINQVVMSLRAYYNYLAYNGFTNLKNISVKPRCRNFARSNTKTRTVVKYLTPQIRSILYQHTSCIRDELLLKSAGECGLRSKENLGFVISDFKVGNKTYSGLESLFLEMEANASQQEFEYFLQGKYVKASKFQGGKSRKIYLHRELLARFKDYYDKERPHASSDTFFLNNHPGGIGTPISTSQATRAFTAARKKVVKKQQDGAMPEDYQMLEDDYTHHVLRHSYGTDKFYEYANKNNMAIDDITTTSQVYLTVAELMGHSAADKGASTTTRTYIRSCHIKDQFEEKDYINNGYM